jgi:hypothetical protein
MKAREIRAALQGKVDPKVVHCLCEMAENQSSQAQEIMMLAQILNKTLDVVNQLGVVTDTAVNAVDEMKKIRGEDH